MDGKDTKSDSSSDEDPQIKRTEVQRKKCVVVDKANHKTSNKEVIISEDDDILLISIMKGIIKNNEI